MAYMKDINTYLNVARELNLNLAMVGAHGRGKTASVRAYAENIGYELITKILSQLEPTDMIGLPVSGLYKDNETAVTKQSYPDWLVSACDPDRKVILFFDEFTNADLDVQASILNLIEDRRIDDMQLSDTTQIVMAFNPPSIAPNAKRLAKATRDRLCVIPIVERKSDFCDYYNANGMGVLSEILDAIDPVNNSYQEEVELTAYENAEFTYRSLEKAYKIAEYCIQNKLDTSIGIELASGYGGRDGKVVYTNIEKLINENHDVGKFEDEVKGMDEDQLISYLRDNKYFDDILEYNKLSARVDKINEIFDDAVTENVIDTFFTKEFKTAYMSSK